LALALAAAAPAPAQPEEERTLLVEGRRRHYLLHAPPGEAGRTPRPLVLVLHGHSGTPDQLVDLSGMSALADREGFLVAYPEGTRWGRGSPRSWNAGSCCGYAVGKQVDDVAFIRALIDDAAAAHPVDAARIYATGISNGGMMAYRLACDLADRIAAIAPVAGALGYDTCEPSQPVSVMVFHGTADASVPYEGGRGQHQKTTVEARSVPSSVAFWVARNGCRPEPQRAAEGEILREAYGGGRGGSSVVLYAIQGGGHAWPGGRKGWWLGVEPTRAISATELMWEFFTQHPKPSGARAQRAGPPAGG
jgi:polyhydroxybutyrate depolymerase